MSVTDTRNTALPELLANVPSLIQWWAFAIQGVVNPPITVVTSPDGITPAMPPQGLAVPAPGVAAKLVIKEDASVQPAAATVPVRFAPPIGFLPVTAPTPFVVASSVDLTHLYDDFVPSPSAPFVPANQDPAPPPPAPAPEPPTILIRLRLDPDDIPDPEQIRSLLFPATDAMAVDAQGFRFSSREAFPAWNPTGLAPLAVAAALPILQERREAAKEARASANLRPIDEALEEYAAMEGEFPPEATQGKDSKPLLSWRVELLPYLGEKGLYDEFHHDEPWDSPHNQKLIARMPAVFANPTTAAGTGITFVRGIARPGQEENWINSCLEISALANDPAFAELGGGMPWTKPEEAIAIEFPANPGEKPSMDDISILFRNRRRVQANQR